MPRYTVTTTPSNITVDAGDILQLKSTGAILVKNNDNAADEAEFLMRGYYSSIDFSSAKTIQVKAAKGTVTVDLVKGL